ncbi:MULTISPECIES: type II toxin-antitoxin system PemK/MazF family toxin [Microbacterium]|uniref:Type II toxin-antitoxin system PemK/MazF family toxin n=1 Tax=Microbacterium wangchenii TaxID=2541726 RepID=A0ABX5SRP3_9MICO|nr:MULTISPECIES: type II toxin-antitoxin system PemK/MazF family toxin [Microbacterium]MCK6065357.1 type II toxin-antitoxin system PemK/MazF family toxin [Microbacterium sp. EYE_512]QBR88801.1 type II toxin-antitoxin system PemK/MazF family toxin [Microbacterium wangchenii]TXK20525.1 type II toxin-antitoxin system PemK/MazF family toxin [Microbacterium wangchenii]
MPSRLISVLRRLLRPARRSAVPAGSDPGRSGATATVQVAPPGRRGVVMSYAPDADGAPDAGEIVWTWVPYEERDGRGKDRPVLVIARQSRDRVYAVRLTSTPHPGSVDHVALGPGEWDSRRRPSWVDLGQLYSVHERGMRREASALDAARFTQVADALQRRYGWRTGR